MVLPYGFGGSQGLELVWCYFSRVVRMEPEDGMTATTGGTGNSVNVRLIGYDNRLFTAAALALSLMAVLYAYGAQSDATQARAEASGAKNLVQVDAEQVTRIQKQADLSNWTVMNLEGVMAQHGIDVPDNLRPHNLTKGTSK